jgi:hypothetical protein
MMFKIIMMAIAAGVAGLLYIFFVYVMGQTALEDDDD